MKYNLEGIDKNYFRVPTPPITHIPPDEKLDIAKPSPKPSFNANILNFREIDEITRKKFNIIFYKKKKLW